MTCYAEKREIFFRGGGCLQQARVGMGKKKEKQRRRGSVEWSYINFCRQTYSVGNSDGKQVTSLHRDSGLNPSVSSSAIRMENRSRHRTSCHFESLGDSVGKITCKNCHVSEPPLFFNLNISSVIPSINTDQSSSPVYTDGMTDVKNSVDNGDRKLPIEVFCR